MNTPLEKSKMKPVYRRGAEIRAVDKRRIKFRASTPAIDRHGTIVKPMGIKTENFVKAGAPFLWGHDSTGGFLGTPNIENVLGNVVDMAKTEEAFDISVEFSRFNPKADIAYKRVKAGELRAVSISFIPLKAHNEERLVTVDGEEQKIVVKVFDESDLLEVSLVPVPSNPEAVVLEKDAMADEMKVFVETQGMILEQNGYPPVCIRSLPGDESIDLDNVIWNAYQKITRGTSPSEGADPDVASVIKEVFAEECEKHLLRRAIRESLGR